MYKCVPCDFTVFTCKRLRRLPEVFGMPPYYLSVSVRKGSAHDAFCVVKWIIVYMFKCVKEEPEADSFKCNRSNSAYCVAILAVVS